MTRVKMLLCFMYLSGLAFSSQVQIVQKPIPLTALRRALTLEYIQKHYQANASSINIQPVMIVVHWTATTDMQRTWNGFAAATLSGRSDIAKGGRLNTSAHFLIGRDGTIWQLMPTTLMARHTIGLNRRAIGIENIGSSTAPLTAAQLEQNAQLIAKLAKHHPIRYLIGHLEYGRFRGSSLWEEQDPSYFTQKDDPGTAFMTKLRARLNQMGLVFLKQAKK